MALEDKEPTIPSPIEPREREKSYISKESSRFKKYGLLGKGRSILRREIIFPSIKALRDVIRGPKIPQKSVDKEKEKTVEKKRGAFDMLFGPTVKKEEKTTTSKTKSSLFGEGEKYIKYEDFEKFLKDPSLYRIDTKSPYERKKEWEGIFPKTGTGYLERWKVEKYFKEKALKPPKTEKEKLIDKEYRKKILGK